MKLATKTAWRIALLAVFPALACLGSTPARADFLDGVRKTFTKDLPHFFQDDIPCAFGGQPTSHTKKSCGSPAKPMTKTKAETSSGRS